MFTGIIKSYGIIRSISKKGDWELKISPSWGKKKIKLGTSISCSGICLTVKKIVDNDFFVDVSNETISKTNVSYWIEGQKINLENSLKVGDELAGHFVTGHIDGVAKVNEIIKIKDSYKLTLEVPYEFIKFFVKKGSVTLDGVSLTVNEVFENKFKVNIIDFTWKETTLHLLVKNQLLNFEIDVISRYLLTNKRN